MLQVSVARRGKRHLVQLLQLQHQMEHSKRKSPFFFGPTMWPGGVSLSVELAAALFEESPAIVEQSPSNSPLSAPWTLLGSVSEKSKFSNPLNVLVGRDVGLSIQLSANKLGMLWRVGEVSFELAGMPFSVVAEHQVLRIKRSFFVAMLVSTCRTK